MVPYPVLKKKTKTPHFRVSLMANVYQELPILSAHLSALGVRSNVT